MLFDGTGLENLIVTILGERGASSAGEIEYVLSEDLEQDYSQQAVYKSLGKLQDNAIVVKRNQDYSLSLDWCMSLISLGESVANTHLSSDSLVRELPRPGRSLKMQFKSLRRLNSFWCHMIIALTKHTGADHILSWNPHAWFYLVRQIPETTYLLSLRNESVRTYKVIGGTTPLDHWCERFWVDTLVQYKFVPDLFPQNSYLTIVGDYLIDITVDEHTVSELETVFSRAQSDADAGIYSEILQESAKITADIEISQSPKVPGHRKKFAAHFDLSK